MKDEEITKNLKTQQFKKLNVEESALYEIYYNLENINIEEGEMHICKRSVEIKGGIFFDGNIENAIISGGSFDKITFINCLFTYELTEEERGRNRFIEINP